MDLARDSDGAYNRIHGRIEHHYTWIGANCIEHSQKFLSHCPLTAEATLANDKQAIAAMHACCNSRYRLRKLPRFHTGRAMSRSPGTPLECVDENGTGSAMACTAAQTEPLLLAVPVPVFILEN